MVIDRSLSNTADRSAGETFVPVAADVRGIPSISDLREVGVEVRRVGADEPRLLQMANDLAFQVLGTPPGRMQMIADRGDAVFVAVRNGLVEGVVTAEVIQEPMHWTYERYVELFNALDPALADARLGVRDRFSVLPSARGAGIGAQLSLAARTYLLDERGCDYQVGAAWDSDAGTVKRIITAQGAQFVAVVPNFWWVDDPALLDEAACSDCGPQCACTALVYVYPPIGESAPSIPVLTLENGGAAR